MVRLLADLAHSTPLPKQSKLTALAAFGLVLIAGSGSSSDDSNADDRAAKSEASSRSRRTKAPRKSDLQRTTAQITPKPTLTRRTVPNQTLRVSIEQPVAQRPTQPPRARKLLPRTNAA